MNKSMATASTTISKIPKRPKKEVPERLQDAFGDDQSGTIYLVRQEDWIFEVKRDSVLALLEPRDTS